MTSLDCETTLGETILFSNSDEELKHALIEATGQGIFVTASVLLEYLFCPRFIFFMNCLDIEQNEGNRYKVQKGRYLHEGREKTNIDYLRKRIGCVAKATGVYLSSEKNHIHGVVDEVLTLSDNTMAPLDYKYAEYKDIVFRTQKYQSVFYGLLIKENYGKDVQRGFVCYVRSKNMLKEILFSEDDFTHVKSMVSEILEITQRGYYPKGTRSKIQCIDCCYRNICV